MIYNTIIKNTNAITEAADLDQFGDETTWGHGGYGESGTGLVGRIMGKPGISKVRHILITSDVNRNLVREYTHRNKMHKRREGFVEGPNEVVINANEILPLVKGHPLSEGGHRQIFSEPPHTTWDNYFSGGNIMRFLGERGLPATVTCGRDRLPKYIPSMYLHKKKTDSTRVPKSARFNEPIVSVQSHAESTV